MKKTPLRKVSAKRQLLLDQGLTVKQIKAAKPKPKVRSLNAIKTEADRLAAAACKSIGRCEAAGWVGPDGSRTTCSDRYEWAHVKSRGQLYLRHDPKNCFCLCSAHHRRFTEHPDHWYRFVEDARPGTWDYLNGQTVERRDTKNKLPLRDVFGEWSEYYRDLNR